MGVDVDKDGESFIDVQAYQVAKEEPVPKEEPVLQVMCAQPDSLPFENNTKSSINDSEIARQLDQQMQEELKPKESKEVIDAKNIYTEKVFKLSDQTGA